MGMFDFVSVGGREGQVKVWGNELVHYSHGDKVPKLHSYTDYSIAMREGGFLNIVDCRLVSWSAEAWQSRVYDKWGNPFVGNVDGDYYIAD